jgi:CSLREA domain-containing protein
MRRAAARRGRKVAALGSGAMLMSGAAGLAVSLSAAPAAAATTFTVDDSGDTGPTAADCAGAPDGDCSLRDAIAAANADAVEDTIVFAASVTGTITLNSDLEGITEAVDITGPGASVLTIDGQDQYQPLFFDDIDTGTPSITGLTITNGDSNGRVLDNSGGAIGIYLSDATFSFSNLEVSSSYAYNDGGGLWCADGAADVTVSNSTFDDDYAGNNTSLGAGGGLYFYCDDLTITGSRFTDNGTYYNGGGLYFAGDALVVSGSTFTGNVASNHNGGAMWLAGNEHTITNTTIDDNHSYGDGGGGLFLSNGTFTMSDSTVSGNTTDDYGGGFYINTDDEVLIERSTISGNEAENNGGGFELYGGEGDVTILASTISGNIAEGTGGGFYFANEDILVTIANSTIAGNIANGNGGGIAVDSGDLSLLQTTISGNTATTGLGDGLYFDGYDEPAGLRAGSHGDRAAEEQARFEQKLARGEAKPGDAPPPGDVTALDAGAATITGTIVSGNIGGDDVNSDGDIPFAITANNSLFGGLTGITLSGAGNLTGVNDPGLGALANNGGPTLTMALSATSPALDVGPATVPAFAGNGFDQRGTGFARVVNGRVDIGAFERELEGLFTG